VSRVYTGSEVQSIVGAWVKIPGLDPREPHALNFLTIEELDKLDQRVQDARAKAVQKAKEQATVKPGDRVLLTRSFGSVKAGTMGIVVQKSAMLGGQYHTAATDFAVAWDGFGLLWTAASYMRKAVGGGAVR
jgi:hypothetical protein